MHHKFVNDEDGYLTWHEENRDCGFVLNATDVEREKDYWRLHKASCPTIRPGTAASQQHFTDTVMFKVVSDNEAVLQKWAEEYRGEAAPLCGTCFGKKGKKEKSG